MSELSGAGKRMNFAKKNSSYSLNKSAKSKPPSKHQQLKKQQMLQSHQHHLEEQAVRRSRRNLSGQNSEAGSFHFLHPDEIQERSPAPDPSDQEQSDIQWSGNADRLI
jgi:predicted Holliday junction resolvase-like endonuclease